MNNDMLNIAWLKDAVKVCAASVPIKNMFLFTYQDDTDCFKYGENSIPLHPTTHIMIESHLASLSSLLPSCSQRPLKGVELFANWRD